MNVLVFNPGSNSLKFEVVIAEPHVLRGEKLISGVVEPIGGPAGLFLFDQRKSVPQSAVSAPDHRRAAEAALDWIDARGTSVDVAAHRVVHGGEPFADPVRIDDDVVAAIEELGDLAPLHNAGSASVIRAARKRLRTAIPSIAVFDTSFHCTIPEYARLYAIPWDLAQKHGIRRYGFHGISHNYMTLRYAELTGTPLDQTNIITLHLEGGSSAAAISGGKSIDTSMGFTPLEGLMMGTRSGDLDPAIIPFLVRKEGVDAATVEGWLNRESGLLGVSGLSQDTRELVKAATDRARLALDMFGYRVKKYIGAYLAAIGNAAAIVFGGGIGENTPYVRQRVCEGLEGLGIQFDPDRNAAVIDGEGRITRDDSRVHALVIPSEEGLMIAHEALRACR
jgi:acetate kinase